MFRFACSPGAWLLSAAATLAAPLPFPKPDRASERVAFDSLVRQLGERGVQVREVNRVGPKTWAVTYADCRGGCLVGGAPGRGGKFEAVNRVGALEAFLETTREAHERRLRELRALGAIP